MSLAGTACLEAAPITPSTIAVIVIALLQFLLILYLTGWAICAALALLGCVSMLRARSSSGGHGASSEVDGRSGVGA